jgi:chitin disaccharide deacetylase
MERVRLHLLHISSLSWVLQSINCRNKSIDKADSRGHLAILTLIADDYAMTAGVSRGILRLLEHGRISGAGAMTNQPSWKGWSHAYRSFSGQRDLGLHLNLTLGKPLTSMPRFAPSASFPTVENITKMGFSLKLPKDELLDEIEAQLDAFENAVGAVPDFIDGHQHVHALPGVRSVLLKHLKERYAKGKKPWLRNPADQISRITKRGKLARKAITIGGLATGFGFAASRAGFLTNDGFAGFSLFNPKGDYAADFACYLKAPGSRHLVMCHPGEVDDELIRLDPVVQTRPQELAFLMSEQASEALQSAGMTLGRLRPLSS